MSRRGAIGLVLGIAIAACAPSALEDEAATSDQAATEASTGDFWGDDRVGDRLRALKDDDECKIPKSYGEIEACFGIGRKCKRVDSQEVYVIEEKQSRGLDVAASATEAILPRAVVTGCNTGRLDDPKTLATSYSIMVGLFSPPSNESSKDPISLRPVEVMAFDRTTGLFNYYVFEEEGVTRVFRDGTKVMERTFTSSSKSASAARESEGKRCFGCHVNGAPIMNEMTNPWTNWVSQAKAFPSTADLTGTSKDLVSLAVPNAQKRTASLAGALETVMKAADSAYVDAFAERVLDGKEAGGISRLLRSTLCETELNYASATDSIPMQVFWDPSVSSTLPKVSAEGDTRVAFQVPVRSEVDKDIELYLVKRSALTATTVQAARLVDDENDVFSESRCALHAEVTSPTTENVNEKLRAAVASHLEGDKAWGWTKTQPARLAYMRALLGTSRPEQVATRAEYMKELAARHRAVKQAFTDETAERQPSFDKIAARKKQAITLLGAGGPAPVLDP